MNESLSFRVSQVCRVLRLLPIYFAYLTTFGFAALDKWRAGAVPEWFQKQFSETILNPFPGALAANFFFLATLETVVVCGLVASLVLREFLPGRSKALLLCSLLLSALVFGMLAMGQRLTGNYGEAATLFFYFSATLVSLLYIEKASI